MKRQGTIVRREKKGYIDEDRTFFCSELVAKTFKVCGIMENTEGSCANFFPGHFGSEKWTIPLAKDIKVVQERTIVKHFEEEEKPEEK